MDKMELHHIREYFDELELNGEYCRVIGNNEACVAISVLFPIREKSILIRGEAGSAKTVMIEGMVQLVWGERASEDEVPEVLVVSGSSEKAMMTSEMADRISNQCTHCVISELENIIGKEHWEDLIKRWLEKRPYIYSRATDFGETNKRFVINPLPVITALANENKRVTDIGEELERRFMTFYTESSSKMNKRVHESKAEADAFPDDVIYKGGMARLRLLQEHYRAIASWKLNNPEAKIKNPCAPFMETAIPTRFTVSNTYVGYALDSVKAVTDWHYNERPIVKVKGHQMVLATPADNFQAWVLCGKAIVYGSLRLKDMGEVIMNAVPTVNARRDIDAANSAAEFNEIYDAICDEGYERSKPQVKQLLMQLLMAGYIRATEGATPGFWKTKDFGGEMSLAVDWKKCVESTEKLMHQHYPEIAEDYISRYCADPKVLHPVTGEELNLLDIKTTKSTVTNVSKTQQRLDIMAAIDKAVAQT